MYLQQATDTMFSRVFQCNPGLELPRAFLPLSEGAMLEAHRLRRFPHYSTEVPTKVSNYIYYYMYLDYSTEVPTKFYTVLVLVLVSLSVAGTSPASTFFGTSDKHDRLLHPRSTSTRKHLDSHLIFVSIPYL